MTDTQKSVEHKLPDAVVHKLMVEYTRGVATAEIANSIRQVSEGHFSVYQQQLSSCLEMLGLDATKQWYVDFAHGVVTDQAPSQPHTNGVSQQPET